jgi:hypothetical protein
VIVVRRFALPALVALATGLLPACKSSDEPSGPNPPPSGGDLETTLSFDPVQPGSGSQLQAAVGFALPASAQPLGAYLIEVHFDPARIAFVATDQAVVSGRVINDLRAGAGSIVVAGAQSGGFGDGLLFKGTFRARVGGVKPSDFSVVVREATDTALRVIVD